MSVLFSSVNYRTSGLQGNPFEMCKTLMAQDQPGWLLLAVEARKLGKSSSGSCLQVAGRFFRLLPLATGLLSPTVPGYSQHDPGSGP